MKSIITFLLALALSGPFTFDKTTHDFGTVKENAGPLSCTFTLSNTSEAPITIFAVITSCGCTEVTWTKEPIEPGAKGTVTATYANEDGPYPFDKTLTVYTSAQKKPVILHLTGEVKRNGRK